MKDKTSFEDRFLSQAMHGALGTGSRPSLKAWAMEQAKLEQMSQSLRAKRRQVFSLSESRRHWPWVAASAAAVVAGFTLVLVGNEPAIPRNTVGEHLASRPHLATVFRPLATGSRAKIEMVDGMSVLTEGWVLVGPESGRLRVAGGATVKGISGHIVVSRGGVPAAKDIEEIIQKLREAELGQTFNNREKERIAMIGNAKKWSAGAAVSVFVLAGSAFIDGSIVAAQDAADTGGSGPVGSGPVTEQANEQQAARAAAEQQAAAMFFKLEDKNGDGKLSSEECGEDFIKANDKNGDGILDLGEVSINSFGANNGDAPAAGDGPAAGDAPADGHGHRHSGEG